MPVNIDAAIFLPGHIADGTESINVPLLGPEQIERLLSLYNSGQYSPFFPYIGEALILMRSKYRCEKTPTVNAWTKIVSECEMQDMDTILCLLLIKYGWDIPQNVMDRCAQYAKAMTDNDAYANRVSPYHRRQERFTLHSTMDPDQFELSRVLHQLDQKRCIDHLIYIAEYCVDTMQSMPKVSVDQLVQSLTVDTHNISNVQLYIECAKTLVDMCVLSSYIGIKLDIPSSIIYSSLFRTCLLKQPMDLLNYYCGDKSIADRFSLGLGQTLPIYDNKRVLTLLMKKMLGFTGYNSALSVIGIPEMHTIPELSAYSQGILGVNPSVSDYSDLNKKGLICPQAWYCGGLALDPELAGDNKSKILKSLAGIWRMHVSNSTHIPLGYIAEVARRLDCSTDDILSSAYSLRMSNISWALKDMPLLSDKGLNIGPKTVHMIRVFVIKHAKKSQTISGLQKMVEVIDGHK
jgi:hypothetical protein